MLDVWPLQLPVGTGSSSQYPLNMQYNATHLLLCSALRSLLRSTTGSWAQHMATEPPAHPMKLIVPSCG